VPGVDITATVLEESSFPATCSGSEQDKTILQFEFDLTFMAKVTIC